MALQRMYDIVIFVGIKFKNSWMVRICWIVIIHMIRKTDTRKPFCNGGFDHGLRCAVAVAGKVTVHVCVPKHLKIPFCGVIAYIRLLQVILTQCDFFGK